MLLPKTIEEIDRALDQCRISLPLMQVRSSKLIVWNEIDQLLDQRKKLSRRRRNSLTRR